MNTGINVGGIVTGPPLYGTYHVGDYVTGPNGDMYFCTISGTPGTWSNLAAHLIDVAILDGCRYEHLDGCRYEHVNKFGTTCAQCAACDRPIYYSVEVEEKRKGWRHYAVDNPCVKPVPCQYMIDEWL